MRLLETGLPWLVALTGHVALTTGLLDVLRRSSFTTVTGKVYEKMYCHCVHIVQQRQHIANREQQKCTVTELSMLRAATARAFFGYEITSSIRALTREG